MPPDDSTPRHPIIRLLGAGDDALLTRVAPEVFDHAVSPVLTAEFLRDPRHHLVVAVDDDLIVGFVSGVHYVHPDKPSHLWINEVSVAPAHRRRGLARQLLQTLLAHARTLGCREAWVGTERSNTAAMRLYASLPEARPPSDFVMFDFDL